ncbi:MAG: hypothetical protein CSB55_07975 [Candidatus Cloacimonadota bacterium]|nr:MAG: hypothetical protein CSB55_07975 [Candidatus Cloacimonadota bacterium]
MPDSDKTGSGGLGAGTGKRNGLCFNKQVNYESSGKRGLGFRNGGQGRNCLGRLRFRNSENHHNEAQKTLNEAERK